MSTATLRTQDSALRTSPALAPDPIYVITRQGVKFNGQYYNSQSLQVWRGSAVHVTGPYTDPAIGQVVRVTNARGDELATARLVEINPVTQAPYGAPVEAASAAVEPFVRLGAYEQVHPRSFTVGRFGVMVNGRFYNNPVLQKHLTDRVRVAVTADPRQLAVLRLDGKHICEAVLVDHADISNSEGELMYRIEITDQFLRYLREVISITETERADLQRRLETQRITRQLAGNRGDLDDIQTGELHHDTSSSQLREGEAPAEPICPRCATRTEETGGSITATHKTRYYRCPDCKEEMSISLPFDPIAQRLQEDATEPGRDYQE